MAKLRIAVITDIHHGLDSGAKLGSRVPRLMDAFAKATAAKKPDFIVDMGDRITARNEKDDRRWMLDLKTHFNKLSAPVHSLMGNHDLHYISAKENEQITGSPAASWSKDEGGYHIVFWNPNVIGYPNGLRTKPGDIEWLRKDLAATDKPTIIFSHVPLNNDPKDIADSMKEAGRTFNSFFYEDVLAIRKTIEGSGKVILCMAGHAHKNNYREINGIHYVTQQSLSHRHQKAYRVPTGTWSLVEMNDNKIKVKLEGKVKKTHDLIPRKIA